MSSYFYLVLSEEEYRRNNFPGPVVCFDAAKTHYWAIIPLAIKTYYEHSDMSITTKSKYLATEEDLKEFAWIKLRAHLI